MVLQLLQQVLQTRVVLVHLLQTRERQGELMVPTRQWEKLGVDRGVSQQCL